MVDLFDSLLAAPALRTFVQYLIAFCSQPEAATDVISGNFVWPIVPDKCVKFCDARLNNSGEIQPKAVGCSIFGCFSNFDNYRPEVDGDVVYSAALDYVGMDVAAKFGDSRSNGGRIIRLFGRPDLFYALLRSI